MKYKTKKRANYRVRSPSIKTVTWVIAVILFFPFVLTPPRAAQTATPTLDETKEWIKGTISTYAVYRDSNDTERTIVPVSFDGCTLICKYSRAWVTAPIAGLRAPMLSEVTFPMASLDASLTKVVKLGPGFNVAIFAKQGRKVMKYQSFGPDAELDTISSAGITFMDEKIAERFAKAVSHAILLCQGKEPF